jgi:hypothetical protein
MPYSQEEIAGQIGSIARLNELRQRTGNKEEVVRYTDSIEVAQEVLLYMLETDAKKMKGKTNGRQ